MTRVNPIIVGSVILAPLILGLEVYALHRSHHHRTPTSPAVAEEETPTTPSRPLDVPRPLPPAEPPPADSQRGELPPPAPEDSPSVTTEAVDAGPEVALWRRRQVLGDHRRQLIRDADEQTFQTLNLPESTRGAIRAIDENYARATQAIQDPGPNAPVDLRNPAIDLNAEQTRNAAISTLLGSEGARAFNAAERKAERNVHNQLRPQWVRGL